MFAAVGLGNIICLCCAIVVNFGLNSALETLVCQAKGANNFRLCGVVLQRGRIVLIAFFLPIMGCFVASKYFFEMASKDAKVVEYAYTYALSMSPGMFMLGQHDLLRKFMVQMGK